MSNRSHHHNRDRTERGSHSGNTPRSLWVVSDQDQDDHSKPHCCGVCQASSAGDYGQGNL
jgi:hypothetical protein